MAEEDVTQVEAVGDVDIVPKRTLRQSLRQRNTSRMNLHPQWQQQTLQWNAPQTTRAAENTRIIIVTGGIIPKADVGVEIRLEVVEKDAEEQDEAAVAVDMVRKSMEKEGLTSIPTMIPPRHHRLNPRNIPMPNTTRIKDSGRRPSIPQNVHWMLLPWKRRPSKKKRQINEPMASTTPGLPRRPPRTKRHR